MLTALIRTIILYFLIMAGLRLMANARSVNWNRPNWCWHC